MVPEIKALFSDGSDGGFIAALNEADLSPRELGSSLGRSVLVE